MRRICVNEYFCFENVLEVSRSVEGVMLCETCLLPLSPPPSSTATAPAGFLHPDREESSSHPTWGDWFIWKIVIWGWGFHSTVKGLPLLFRILDSLPRMGERDEEREERQKNRDDNDDFKSRLKFIHAFLVLKSLNIGFINFFT